MDDHSSSVDALKTESRLQQHDIKLRQSIKYTVHDDAARDTGSASGARTSLATDTHAAGHSVNTDIRSVGHHDDVDTPVAGNDVHARSAGHQNDVVAHATGRAHVSPQPMADIVRGVYWSVHLEHLTVAGFSEAQAAQWREKLRRGKVSELSAGCGRMQNRLVTLDDGSQLCARYRVNNDQIQGEVYSYYLAQLLGIHNVPPAILERADPAHARWRDVDKALDAAKWSAHKLLVLTPFVHDLRKVYIPVELREEERSLAPTTPSLVNASVDELSDLLQWSDLILLDYLTANVDRVVNNMFNLQWSAGMMAAPTHNLERAGPAGPLVFMDNESGLLHSYRLLDKYSHYHDKLLAALCVFRKTTADAIKKYHKTGELASDIKELFKAREPLAERLAPLPQANVHVLNQRLAAVYRQIVHCEHLYGHR